MRQAKRNTTRKQEPRPEKHMWTLKTQSQNTVRRPEPLRVFWALAALRSASWGAKFVIIALYPSMNTHCAKRFVEGVVVPRRGRVDGCCAVSYARNAPAGTACHTGAKPALRSSQRPRPHSWNTQLMDTAHRTRIWAPERYTWPWN
ncbi:hypothetical protein NDU88_011183 [Pleurodeles waltl]|uniref:Uncharacterized protein n=1 Tax=Pleurodeles waltl TaxID=8319 RepID=A0AAV7PWZ7_PLEWA|nr:hypothetical protein NDU88_011183 [Pleurodeles waltl]